jgi:hypothetical protein
MSNSILTPTAVTREALRVLHQKCNFITNINTQYDDSFANSGAKIGDSLKIRLPNQYAIRTGRLLNVQDTQEESVTLQVSSQKGVDVNFTSADLTLSLDDFSKRILEPAMAVLAANVEADALSMYKNVWNLSDEDGTAFTLLSVLKGRQYLNDNLTPMDNNRTALLQTSSAVKLMDGVKALFHDGEAIKKQYREGKVGRTGGFDFYENTLLVPHTTGTAAKTTGYDMNTSTGITSGSGTLTIATGSTSFLVGDVVTIAGVNRVHPETKVDTNVAQQFVVTEDSGTSATSLKVSPTPITSGAKQNIVINSAGASKAITKVAAGASETIQNNLVFHRDAFAFATADLVMPKGVDFSARENYDGLSLRVVRQYDINNDTFPCRIDIMYGYKAIRPQMACRVHADG